MTYRSSIDARLFVKRLDCALANRRLPECRTDDYENIKCEVCGDMMRRYIGPLPGAICTVCLEPSGEAECVRTMPLAITRSTLSR
jgi:hypothetical protein